MKKQNTAVWRAALAVLISGRICAAVMYLRVTISVPAEGDDKLTLNGWLYDMGRMSFWQYALQDLKERLSFFLLKQVRFFPFHYPNAVALLFYRTLASYRLYIIAMTGAAAFLVSRVAAKLSRSNALALGAFGLALAAAPIFNEGMYSYYAVPQQHAALAAGQLAGACFTCTSPTIVPGAWRRPCWRLLPAALTRPAMSTPCWRCCCGWCTPAVCGAACGLGPGAGRHGGGVLLPLCQFPPRRHRQ